MRVQVAGRVGLTALAAAVMLAGCSRGNGTSASASGDAGPSGGGGGDAYAAGRDHGGGGRSGYGGGSYGREDRAPVPSFHGEPMWSENRAHTAQENAQYHFQRAGADLGARTLDDFLTKVHRFGDHPPPGTLKMSRPNGDRLLYDPKANLFAVFTRDGAPRTVFKPTDGMAYWTEQKQRLASGDDGGYRRRSYGGYGGGGGGYGRGGGGDAGGDQGQ